MNKLKSKMGVFSALFVILRVGFGGGSHISLHWCCNVRHRHNIRVEPQQRSEGTRKLHLRYEPTSCL
jgi:hypothetical protein